MSAEPRDLPVTPFAHRKHSLRILRSNQALAFRTAQNEAGSGGKRNSFGAPLRDDRGFEVVTNELFDEGGLRLVDSNTSSRPRLVKLDSMGSRPRQNPFGVVQIVKRPTTVADQERKDSDGSGQSNPLTNITGSSGGSTSNDNSEGANKVTHHGAASGASSSSSSGGRLAGKWGIGERGALGEQSRIVQRKLPPTTMPPADLPPTPDSRIRPTRKPSRVKENYVQPHAESEGNSSGSYRTFGGSQPR